jgi:hypothetical protein
MQLIFQNGQKVEIILNNSLVSTTILQLFKHLRHVSIPFYAWDNPYFKDNYSWDNLVSDLHYYGRIVDVDVDRTALQTLNQPYLNHLHYVYEKNYNGSREWLEFHEHIHACEEYFEKRKTVYLDYRETSGLLEKQFDHNWLKDSATYLKAGDIYVQWAELGKIPYNYWRDGEPDDIDRICQLAKPWLILKPKLRIAVEDIDMLENKKITEFNQWWAKYQDKWCQYWQIASWPVETQFAQLPFGNITQIETVIDLLKNKIYPNKILLA